MPYITTISNAIRVNLGDFLLTSNCCRNCSRQELITNLFNNDIDTILNLEVAQQVLTYTEVDALAAFAGVENDELSFISTTGAFAGVYPLLTFTTPSFSTGTVEPGTGDFNCCILNQITEFLLSSHCCRDCSRQELAKNLFFNDIETVLSYDIAEEVLTDVQINALLAFTGCLYCPVSYYSPTTGAFSGGLINHGCCNDENAGDIEVNENYPYIGYVGVASTYEYDLSNFEYGEDTWILIDNNYEYVGIPEDADDLLDLLNDMTLGAFSITEDTLSVTGNHFYGEFFGTPVESEPENEPPVVDAGEDQIITLPTSTAQLNASATDPDGTIVSTLCELLFTSAAGGGTISNSTILNPTLSVLEEGTYTYRFTATDNDGATGTDEVVITVLPAVYAGYSLDLVFPNETDPDIDEFTNKQHYAYTPTAPIGKLHVFLPGSNAKPSGSTYWLANSALLGFHTIGLYYDNVLDNTGPDMTPDQYVHEYMREMWFGEDFSIPLDVTPANCIENRILKLLQYMDDLYPAGGWDDFFYGDEIVWEKLTVSGHSQGGNYVGTVMLYKEIDRAIMVSSPRLAAGTPWGTFLTPLADARWFWHNLDLFGTVDQHTINQGMGVVGSPVDTYVTPEGSWTHELKTSYPCAASVAHKIVLNNSETPIVADVPYFKPVWDFLLTGS